MSSVNQQISVDFCKETTIHALPRIADNRRTGVARVAWLIILLVFVAGLAWQTHLLAMKLLRFGRNTQTDLVISNQQNFPAVILCNSNPFIRTKLPKDSTVLLIDQMLCEVTNYVSGANSQMPCGNPPNASSDEDYNYEFQYTPVDQVYNRSATAEAMRAIQRQLNATGGADYFDLFLDTQSLLKTIQGGIRGVNMFAAERRDFYKVAWQQQKDFILDCTFNGQRCIKSSFFKQVPHTRYGVCYRFNSDGSVISTSPGMQYGLDLLLNVQSEEYLMTTAGTGVRVHVHDPTVTAFPEINAYAAATGTSVSMAISRMDTERLPSPYGDCFPNQNPSEQQMQQYYYEGGYTMEGCRMSCLQKHIVLKCKCWHYAYALPPDVQVPICKERANLKCASDVESEVTSKNSSLCQCYAPCAEMQYRVALSHTRLELPPYLVKILYQNSTTDISDPYEFSDRNLLRLRVYFETLNYYKYSEAPEYSGLSFISDFGGQFGLWIGASFCSVVEILSLILSVICGCFKCTSGNIEKKEHQVQPTTNDKKATYPSIKIDTYF